MESSKYIFLFSKLLSLTLNFGISKINEFIMLANMYSSQSLYHLFKKYINFYDYLIITIKSY